MAKLSIFPKFIGTDNDGNPLVGGKLYTYEAGTTTPKATYTNAGGLTANTNPVVLDSAGRADVWLGDGAYKFVLKTSADVTLWTVDNISGDAQSAFGGSYNTLSSNTLIDSTYANSVNACSATLTLTLTPASTAGEGFYFTVKNTSASNTVTVDPDASELIDGATTLSISAGQSCLIICTGTAWTSLFLTTVNPVTASSAFGTDNRALRSDGAGRGAQSSGVTIDDSNNISGALQISSGSYIATSAAPLYRIAETDASANAQIWEAAAVGGVLTYRTQNDAISLSESWLEVYRTNHTINYLSFPNGNITLGGASAATGYTADGSITAPASSVARFKNTSKFWVNFNGTGTVAIRDSFNVTSITDNGTGDYTINFTNALTDANYFVGGMCSNDSTATTYVAIPGSNTQITTSSVRVTTIVTSTGATRDPTYVGVVGHGL